MGREQYHWRNEAYICDLNGLIDTLVPVADDALGSMVSGGSIAQVKTDEYIGGGVDTFSARYVRPVCVKPEPPPKCRDCNVIHIVEGSQSNIRSP